MIGKIKSKRSTRAQTSSLNSNFIKSKRSQEEMVGFVLIIILVSVISLVFLGISVRKKTITKSNFEIQDFLQAASKITTECESYSTNYLDVGGLIKSCLENNGCVNGKNSCEVLNETIIDIIDKSWLVCEDCPITGFIFEVKYLNKTEYRLEQGICGKTWIGGEYLIPYSGENIIVNLKKCSKN